MSDLQCPARFLVLVGPDADDARALADALRHERIAAVYDEPSGPEGTAALAEALGLPLREVAHRPATSALLAERPEALEELRDLADLHRGETVCVAAEGPPGSAVEVAVDGDGVTVTALSWPTTLP